jgi:hypothetical protein
MMMMMMMDGSVIDWLVDVLLVEVTCMHRPYGRGTDGERLWCNRMMMMMMMMVPHALGVG